MSGGSENWKIIYDFMHVYVCVGMRRHRNPILMQSSQSHHRHPMLVYNGNVRLGALLNECVDSVLVHEKLVNGADTRRYIEANIPFRRWDEIDARAHSISWYSVYIYIFGQWALVLVGMMYRDELKYVYIEDFHAHLEQRDFLF